MRSGEWSPGNYLGFQLEGRQLGVVGFGHASLARISSSLAVCGMTSTLPARRRISIPLG